jgi:hypothetical protein
LHNIDCFSKDLMVVKWSILLSLCLWSCSWSWFRTSSVYSEWCGLLDLWHSRLVGGYQHCGETLKMYQTTLVSQARKTIAWIFTVWKPQISSAIVCQHFNIYISFAQRECVHSV